MADFPDSTPMTEISRPVIEAEIELLIDLLDQFDENPDAEPDEDGEPWLGAPNARTGSWFGSFATDPGDDREEDDYDREPCCEDEGAQCEDEGSASGDDEMTLGAPNDKAGSWFGCGDNCDEDNETDNADDEPWLAAQNPESRYHHPFVVNLFHRHDYPHLYKDVETQRTSETSQLSWGVADSTDDREWDDEREPETDSEVETWGLPFGPCSPITAMLRNPVKLALF